MVDVLYCPFYGSRRIATILNKEPDIINHKKVMRLMKIMGIEAIYQKSRKTTYSYEIWLYVFDCNY